MTTWFISRHPGACDWAAQQGLHIHRQVAHLDPAEVEPGDTVIGTLPVHLAAAVCQRGARYLNLSLDLPAHARGGAFQCRTAVLQRPAGSLPCLPPPDHHDPGA